MERPKAYDESIDNLISRSRSPSNGFSPSINLNFLNMNRRGSKLPPMPEYQIVQRDTTKPTLFESMASPANSLKADRDFTAVQGIFGSKKARDKTEGLVDAELGPKITSIVESQSPADEPTLIKFVEKFKSELADINDKLDKEKRKYYIKDYSRELSEQIYSTVIKWNQEVRDRLPQEEQTILTLLRQKFKPFISFKGYVLPFVRSSKLNQDFQITEELDWSRRLYFLTKIDAMQTEQFDPIHRHMVRLNNRRLFAASTKDYSQDMILKRLVDTQSPRLYVLAMQHGLVTETSMMVDMIKRLSGKLKQLLLYTENFKRQTKTDESPSKFPLLSTGKATENGIELLEEEGLKIIEGLDNFISVNQRSDMERASDLLKFLIHCIVLHNDQTFVKKMTARAGEEDDDWAFFSDTRPLFKEIKTTLFDSLVADNFECLLGLKEDQILLMVMELTNCMIGDCHDLYGRCLKLFREHGSINKSKKLMQHLPMTETGFNPEFSKQQETIKFVENLIIEIIEGRRGKSDYCTEQELLNQVEILLKGIAAEIEVNQENVQKKVLISRFYAVSNIVHFLLNLATMFTASKKGSKFDQSRNIIRLCLNIIKAIMKHYPPAKCMIFSSKEWFFVQRLYQFYPCDCLQLILEAITDNQPIVLSSETKAQMIVDFLLCQVNLELPKLLKFVLKYSEPSDDITKALKNFAVHFVDNIQEKIEKFEEEVSIILMFRCLRTLLSNNTSQILNRKYSVEIQKNCLYWLRIFVWEYLLRFDSRVVKINSFFVELKTSAELQKLLDEFDLIEHDSRAVALEICYSVLFTLNTTCLYGRIFDIGQLFGSYLEAESKVETYEEASQFLHLSKFTHLIESIHGGLVLAELSKLISHVQVLEFSLIRQDYLTVNYLTMLDQIKDSISVARINADILVSGYETLSNHLEEQSAGQKLLEVYTLRGIIEPVHKLINGIRSIILVISDEKVSSELMELLSDLLVTMGTIERSPPVSETGRRSTFIKKYSFKIYALQFNAIERFINTYINIPRQGKRSGRTNLEPSPSLYKMSMAERADGNKQATLKQTDAYASYLGKIIFQLESCICEMDCPTVEKEYAFYATEIIENLQEKASEDLTTMPKDGNWNMETLRERIAKVNEVSSKDHTVIENETVTTEGKERKRLLKRLRKYVDTDLLDCIEHYLERKRECAKIEKHMVEKMLDDGVDERPDAYYLMILYLITQELSKMRDQYTSVAKEENFTSNKFKFMPLDLIISNKPIIEQLLKIFDNLLYVRGKKIRNLFHSTFFEDSKEDFKQDFDDNEMKPSSGSSLHPFKTLKQMGPKTVDFLFHATITFQRKICRSVFNKDFSADCQLYFLLCFVIKSLAEENFLKLKTIFHKLMIEVTGQKKKKREVEEREEDELKENNEGLARYSKLTKSAFSLLLNGVAIPKHNSREIKPKYATKSDRPELVWYNIATAMLLSELSFGLNSVPSDVKAQKINKMLLFFNSFNVDIFNAQYDLMEEIARLVSFLLESSPKLADNLLNLKRPDKVHPGHMYNQIVNLMKLLVVSFKRISDNSNNKKKNRLSISEVERKMAQDIDKVIKNTDGLVNYYKKYQRFANHSIIKIGRMLNKIMNTLASSTTNRLFGTYMDELKKEAEAMQKSSYTSVYKGSVKNTNKLLKGFKKNNKTYKSQVSYSNRFSGIKLYNFLHRISSTVEIAVHEKQSIILEFAIVPEALFISDITKKEFIDSVPIGDHNAKLVNMIDVVKDFQREGFNSFQLSQKWPFLSLFSSNAAFKNMIEFIYFITLVLNGIALGTLDFKDTMDLTLWYWKVLFFGSVAVDVLSVLVAILYIVINFDHKTRSRIYEENWNQIKSEKLFKKPVVFWKIAMKALNNLINNHSILLVCFLYIVFSSLSLVGYWYMLPFHLLMLAKVSQTASYIIMSIRLHFDQLLRTFLLILLLIYTSTLLIGFYFRQDFRDNNTVYLCESLSTCFIYCTDLGLRTGGGITNVMNSVAYTEPQFFPKFVLDMAHFIFINMIALNIFAGIIIDTFKELRTKLEIRSKSR